MDETSNSRSSAQAVIGRRPGGRGGGRPRGLAAGIAPLHLIDEAAMPALRDVGDGFSNGDLFLPDLMLAARAMQAAMRVIEPALGGRRRARASAGRVVLGTVNGDIHEIGKNLVGHAPVGQRLRGPRPGRRRVAGGLRRQGGRGRRRPGRRLGAPDHHDDRASAQWSRRSPPPACGPQVKVMIGGAPVTRAWAEEIGADAYAEDAIAAVDTPPASGAPA